MKKKIIRFMVVGALCAFFLALGFWSWNNSRDVEYKDCLDKVIFTANGQEVQMKDLAFYILYEEREVESQAMVYNPQNTKDYWNLHIDGVFMQVQAKDTILQMAIHDKLFYQKAVEEDMTLDAGEEQLLRNVISDFWMDLLDEQMEKMPVSEEYIMEAMRQIALAEKYQAKLAEKEGKAYASYNWDGYEYGLWKEKQDVDINEKLWEKIVVGDITLDHGAPNYMNGHNKKEDE